MRDVTLAAHTVITQNAGQEELTLAVGAAYAIPAVALRFFNVYGARLPNALAAEVLLG